MAIQFTDTDNDDILAEINITPLTDVFMVLLIIFMISSSAMMESGLNVKLPTAKSTSLTQKEDGEPTFITVSKDGAIQVGQDPSTSETLEEQLRNTLQGKDNKTVIIRGDEGIVLGQAVQIMDAARAAGAEKIALATQPGSGGK